MTLEDVQKIENELGIRIPQHYLEAHKLFPELIEECNADGVIEENVAAYDFIRNSEYLLHENQRIRTYKSKLWKKGDNDHWPKNWLVIGVDPGGNFWYIDGESSSESVGFVCHDPLGIKISSPTLIDHIRASIKVWKEIEGKS